MSINYLLIWLTGFGGVFAFLRVRGREELELKVVRRGASITLCVLVATVYLAPDLAGIITFFPWVGFLVVPQVLLSNIIRTFELGDFQKFEYQLRWLSFFPQGREWGAPWFELYEAEQNAQHHHYQMAAARFLSVANSYSLAAPYGRAKFLLLHRAWNDLLEFANYFSRRRSAGAPSFFFLRLRAIALTALGLRDEAWSLVESAQEWLPPGSPLRREVLEGMVSVSSGHSAEALSSVIEQERHLPIPGATRFSAINLIVVALLLSFIAQLNLGIERSIEYLAFDPYQIWVLGEWWRLLSCGFAHIDALHLGSNVLGLLVLGPFLLERLGSVRFSLFFLLSIAGASVIILGLTVNGIIPPRPMIGASGGVMGIVGGYLAFYLGTFLRTRSMYHLDKLRGVLLIVGLQALFDLLTPQVSFFAHFGGLLSGFILFPCLKREKKS